MPYTLLLAALPAAHAGLALGAIGGAAVAPRPTAESGLWAGAFGGWEIERDGTHLRPELLIHLNRPGEVLTASVGVAARWGEVVAPGVYAHVGVPLVGYPLPAADAGLLLEVRSWGAFRPGLRLGAEYSHPVRDKCGNCLQPPDFTLDAGLVVGVAF